MSEWQRQSWIAAEPTRVAREKAAMAETGPELLWQERGGWEGLAPVWPFDRPAPAGLEGFLAGRRFRLRVIYSEGFPMVPPVVWPLDPEPDPRVRTRHDWHVNGDGSLCLFQAVSDWSGCETAAELVVKSTGWFLEYLLMEEGRIAEMTTDGIVTDGRYDHLLVPATDVPAGNP